MPLCRIRDITKKIAAAVVREAVEEDLAEGYRDMDAKELQKLNEVESEIPPCISAFGSYVGWLIRLLYDKYIVQFLSYTSNGTFT